MNEDDQFIYVKKNTFMVHVNEEVLHLIYNKLSFKMPYLEKIIDIYYKKQNNENCTFSKMRRTKTEDGYTVISEAPTRYVANAQSLLTLPGDSTSANMSSFWRIISYILNHPVSFEVAPETSVFNNIISSINSERQDYVIDFVNYSKFFKQKENINLSTAPDDYTNSIDFLIFRDMNKIFLNFLENNQKYRELMHFYIWMLNNLMFYDFDTQVFEANPIAINKSIIFSTGFHKLIIKIIKKNAHNLNHIDYTISLVFRLLNNYLLKLDIKQKGIFLDFIVNNPESQSIFFLMKTIVDDFNTKLNKGVLKSKSNNFFSKFEQYVDSFDEIVCFISSILDSNLDFDSKNKIRLRDYLRFQDNKIKSFNFISLLSRILMKFKLESDKKNYAETFKKKMKIFVSHYESIIIIIEALTKACKVISIIFDNLNIL